VGHDAYAAMSDGAAEHVKKFLFTSRNNRSGEDEVESLEVFIPEVLNQNLYTLNLWMNCNAFI